MKNETKIFSISNTVAWFTFDPTLSDANGSGLVFSNDLSTVSVDGWDHRVALGSVGFSRGIHYWEFTINKYTPDTDPAFGIARIDVARDQMLGKSIQYWSLIKFEVETCYLSMMVLQNVQRKRLFSTIIYCASAQKVLVERAQNMSSSAVKIQFE